MNLYIKLTLAGNDTGPFNIYSDVDNFNGAFEGNISKSDLLFGFATNNAPNGTEIIRVRSINKLCSNFVDTRI